MDFKLVLVVVALVAGVSAEKAECIGMERFCTTDLVSFASSVDVVVQNDPNDFTDYGCLNTYPNPAWYYMEIAVGGDMDIYMESAQENPLDIDFALWGPFSNLDSAIGACDTYTAPTSCSYSPEPAETAIVRNSNVGEIWVLLVTNYANQENSIRFKKVEDSGMAETNCDFIFCSGELDGFNNAMSSCGSIEPGRTCEASCMDGYEWVSGSMTRVCGSSGVYEEFTGMCELPMMNECNDDPCDMNADCFQDDMGMATCICHEGYTGDGYFCEMIEEPTEEGCTTTRVATNTININFADTFAGYEGTISASSSCCSCGCGCGCGCCA